MKTYSFFCFPQIKPVMFMFCKCYKRKKGP